MSCYQPASILRCNNLVLEFDISNIKSWKRESNFEVKSLVKDKNLIIDDIELNTFGLTGYDVGRVDTMFTGLTIDRFINDKLKLYPIDSNVASGDTYYTAYTITTASTEHIGHYFNLRGGYLSNFFKLFGYNYQAIPYRFKKGFTIETTLNFNTETISSILDENDGFFLYLGARAENKYSIQYSGESNYSILEGDLVHNTDGILLGSDHPSDKHEGIYDNNIGFRVNEEGKIGYRFITKGGFTKEEYTCDAINHTGWKVISLTFLPEDIFEDDDLLDCFPTRKGKLTVYINGLVFHEFNDFQEIWFKELNTEKEKQIGVPFTINWGGGSFGLKHSYHLNNGGGYEKDVNKNRLLIERNFGGSFIGGIQKLRIYDRPLNFTEIRNNFNAEAIHYNLYQITGGRVIHTNVI